MSGKRDATKRSAEYISVDRLSILKTRKLLR